MKDYTISVMLQFPAMPTPYRVRVSPRQLYFLDTNSERSFAPDGTVVYRLPRSLWHEGLLAVNFQEETGTHAA